jgi:16S rRNA (guanine1207-N2)-methyltransferase
MSDKIRTKNWRGPSQLLYRDKDKIAEGRLLVIGCPTGEIELFLKTIGQRQEIVFFCFDYSDYLKISDIILVRRETGAHAIFDHWYIPSKPFDCAVIYLPKSLSLIEYTLALASNSISAGGTMLLVGENNSSIRSSKPAFEKFVGKISFSDAARHSVLHLAQKETATNFKWQDFVSSYQFEFGGKNFKINNLPGVFSLDKLDRGTKLLLETLKTEEVNGKVLDFGCGSGVIGLAAKTLSPKIILCECDNSALAIESAKLTAETNKIQVEKIFPSNIFSDVKENYDLMISNPPFHKGLKTDNKIVSDFIRNAKTHLVMGGRIRLVANSFLPYDKLLQETFGNSKKIIQTPSYCVHEAKRLS